MRIDIFVERGTETRREAYRASQEKRPPRRLERKIGPYEDIKVVRLAGLIFFYKKRVR